MYTDIMKEIFLEKPIELESKCILYFDYILIPPLYQWQSHDGGQNAKNQIHLKTFKAFFIVKRRKHNLAVFL